MEPRNKQTTTEALLRRAAPSITMDAEISARLVQKMRERHAPLRVPSFYRRCLVAAACIVLFCACIGLLFFPKQEKTAVAKAEAPKPAATTACYRYTVKAETIADLLPPNEARYAGASPAEYEIVIDDVIF